MTKQHTSKGVAFATLILWALALCFAAVSSAYWVERLAGHPVWQAVAVTASVLVSLSGPACASNIKTRGALLVLPALVFLGADCWQNMRGVQSFDFLSNGEAIEVAQIEYDKAKADVDSLPTSQEVCVGHGPLNCEARKGGLAADRKVYGAALTKAATALEEAKAPKYADTHVAGVMALLQLAVCFGLALLGKPSRPEPQPAQSAPRLAASNGQRVTPKMSEKDQKVWEKISAAQ